MSGLAGAGMFEAPMVQAATYVISASFPTDGSECDDALDRAISAAVSAARGVQSAISSNQYFRGGVVLQLPAGPFLFKRGHVIDSAHIKVVGAGSTNTVLMKSGDFGDLLNIIDPKTRQNSGNSGFIGIGAIDIGPTSGGALLRLTNCSFSLVHDIATHNGFYGLQIDGVTDTVIDTVRCTSDAYFGQTTAQKSADTSGSYKAGSALIAFTASGSNGNSDIKLRDFIATGDSASTRLCATAVLINSADVMLVSGGEVGAVADADMHVSMSGALSVQGLQVSSTQFDNGSPYGLLVDGSTTGAVTDWIIEGRFFGHDTSHIYLDCPNLAAAIFRAQGLGAGGTPIVVMYGTDLQFDAPMLRGFGGTATGAHQFSGIDIRTSNVAVTGGVIKPYSRYDLSYGIRLSDGLSGCTVTGTTSAPGATAYGAVRCTNLNANTVANNLVIGGAPVVGYT